jgi:small subunit ribosomal protein S20
VATHSSALKKARQDRARRVRNRMHRSRLRTGLRRIRKLVAEGDANSARELLPRTLSLIDHSAQRGMIHRNAAARTKSRITRAVHRLPA